MVIFHYSLGFPPYRTGGLTKYCIDLMHEQSSNGHSTFLLWPGSSTIHERKKIKFKIHKNTLNLGNIEIINPLPVPLLEGICNVKKFTENRNANQVKKLIETYKPQVLHVHTLMGLPSEIIDIFNEYRIPIFFTTHDYFGICPKTTLIKSDFTRCNNDHKCEDCKICNSQSLPIWKLRFLQSSYYRNLKNVKLIQLLRKRHNNNIEERNGIITNKSNQDFSYLRLYYKHLLESFTCIFFNSENTKTNYLKYINSTENKVISITHKDIQTKFVKKEDIKNEVQLTYLGPQTAQKGYFEIKNVLSEIYKEKKNFCLNIYFNDTAGFKLKCNKRYKYNELESVMSLTDILLVPSKGDTFGFTVLEALSYGVPAIVSKYVGAKDLIIHNENGYIYNNAQELKDFLLNILNHTNILKEMNEQICKNQKIKTLREHSKEIINEYSAYMNHEKI